ncbi:MAG: hypothetical protein K2I21_04660, partial [Acetatifactor sp.]|nr:hypothetical protein [Acetatifactor sp.]
VLGRKDVGGIVGQMEPFMEVEYIDGKLDELDREMDIFLDMLEVSHDHLSAYGDQTMAITRQLNANLRNVSVSASNLLNITNDLWNVYNQELSGISGDFDRLSNDLRAISDREKEEEKSQESEGGGESQEGEIPEGESQDGESQDGEQSGEPADVETGGQDQDRQALGDQLEDWREELESVSGGDHIDWNRPGEGNIPEDWKKPQYTQEYRDALSNFAHSTSSHLHKVTDTTSQQSGQVSHNLEVFNLELKAAMDHLTELTDTLDAAQKVVDADVDALIAQARKLRRMFSDIRDELFGYEGITVNDTSDEAASESIENAGVDELQQELLQEGDTVTEKWYDTASFQQGKITLCQNSGLIAADTSVAGIVGQIAIEHDLDPEDDITFTGPESL